MTSSEKTMLLPSGEVTLSWSVDLFGMSEDDRNFLFGLFDAFVTHNDKGMGTLKEDDRRAEPPAVSSRKGGRAKAKAVRS